MPNACVIWIASAPDTEWRHRDSHSALDEDILRARRANFNVIGATPEIVEVAQTCGIDVASEPPNSIIAAALVQPAFCYDELRCLSREERLQYNVYQRLTGSSLVGTLFLLYP